jgi:hypothetical protein
VRRFAALLLVALGLLAVASPAQTCPSNQADMLTWMLPWQGLQNGHFDVLYPASGTFYWVKGAGGYPWDVDAFDGKYVYQVDTELVWNQPTTFKRFVHPLRWMPRCVSIPQTPGKIATVTVPASDADFEIHSSCTQFTPSNLGNIVNELWWNPSQVVGANPAQPTITLSYRYSCDSSYSTCKYKETFALQQGNGLVQWTYYQLQSNGQYLQLNQTTHGVASPGSVQPVHPCW